MNNDKDTNEIQALRAALHRISLGSQDSSTSKEDLGKEARNALLSTAQIQGRSELSSAMNAQAVFDLFEQYRCSGGRVEHAQNRHKLVEVIEYLLGRISDLEKQVDQSTDRAQSTLASGLSESMQNHNHQFGRDTSTGWAYFDLVDVLDAPDQKAVPDERDRPENKS